MNHERQHGEARNDGKANCGEDNHRRDSSWRKGPRSQAPASRVQVSCPPLRDQFLKKLQACCNPLEFNDDSKQIKEKSDRQTYLQEFNDYLNDQNCMSTVIIPHLDLVINMIEKNIFRPLPVLKKQGLPGEGIGMEEVTIDLLRKKRSPTPPGLISSLSTSSSSSSSSTMAQT